MENRPPANTPGPFDARYLAFLETVTQLRPKLHRFCARMTGSALDGEDVVQEALFDAYRRLERYDDSRPLAPWLFRIAHNRCIDFLRRREARREAEHAAAREDPAVVDAVDPSGPALGRAVEHLVLALPPKERACVLLKDVFDYSLEEIAELVDSTPGGVKAALHRGRGKLTATTLRPVSHRTISRGAQRVLQLYVERFNRRDWDGLRALIAADARLHVADRYDGRLSESPYFSRYAELTLVWRARPGEVDGEPVVVVEVDDGNRWTPHAVVRMTIADDRITAITDYKHCVWVAAAAHVSPMPPPA